MAAALLVFLGTYLAIGLGSLPFVRIDRPAAALLGALGMVVLGVVSLEQAYEAIHLPTLALLLGLMLLACELARAGFFAVLAEWMIVRFRSATALLAAVVVASGLLSALFLNDAVCILFTPLVLRAAKRAGRDPLPYLIGVATASNVGGACTITGNPQNVLIGHLSGISYGEFLVRLAPASLLSLALTWCTIALVYRRRLAGDRPAARPVEQGPEPGAVLVHERVEWRRILLTLGVAASMLVAFLAGIDVSLAALAAGAGMLVFDASRRSAATTAGRRFTGLAPSLARADLDPFAGVDWTLLVLFAGLFVVTEGVRESGLASGIVGTVGVLLEESPFVRLAGLSAVSIALSNLVSNVPAVMLLEAPLRTAGSDGTWLTVAMASTFAGNLTIVGSIANLIVAQLAREECPITYVEYLKVGVPLTLGSTAIGIAVLFLQGA